MAPKQGSKIINTIPVRDILRKSELSAAFGNVHQWWSAAIGIDWFHIYFKG